MRRWRKERLLLFCILALGAALRVWGLRFGLPQLQARPDEFFIVTMATEFFSGDWNPHFFEWPSLFFYAVHGMMRAHYVVGLLFGRYPDLQTFVSVITESPASVVLFNRVVGVVCGVLTLAVLYRVATKIAGAAPALMATFFLAVAMLHVRDSHFGLVDVPLTLLIMVSSAFLVKAWQDERSLRHFLIAGAVAGFATSIKYSAGALVFTACVVALLNVLARPAHWRRTLVGLTACGGAMVGTFLVGSPYVLLDHVTFLHDLGVQRAHLLRGHYGLVVENAWLHHLTFSLRYGLGLPTLIAALAGIGIMLARDWRRAAVLLSFPAISFVVLGIGHLAFARHMIPLLPFLCIAAGIGVWGVASWMTASPGRGLVAAAVAIAIAAPSFLADVALDRLFAREDTRVLAAQWLVAHDVPPATTYAAGDTLFLTGPHVEFSTTSGFFVSGEAHITPATPEWIVLSESPLPRYTTVPEHVRNLVVRDYTLKQMFLGARAPEPPEWFDQQDAFFVPLASLRLRDRPGPDVYIYQRR